MSNQRNFSLKNFNSEYRVELSGSTIIFYEYDSQWKQFYKADGFYALIVCETDQEATRQFDLLLRMIEYGMNLQRKNFLKLLDYQTFKEGQ